MFDKKKVVIVTDMLWGGGRERRIVRLITGLSLLKKYELHLVLLDDGVDYPEIFDVDVRVHVIKRRNARDLSVYWKLFVYLNRIKPDIINPWSYMSVAYSAPIAVALGVQCVGAYVVDAKAPRFLSINWFAKCVGDYLCSKVIANSHAGHAAYGTPSKKRVVIYNGIDVDDFSVGVHESKSKNLLIGMVGRIDHQKDYHCFIDGVALLIGRELNVKGYIIGQGLMRDEVAAYAMQKCASAIELLGFRKDVAKVMAECDVGVLCSNANNHAEGISNALMEFMALGRPVVATKGGGTNELVDDGITGFLIEPGDWNALADKTQLLLQDSSLRDRMGVAAKKRIIEKFSLKRMVVEFDELFGAV